MADHRTDVIPHLRDLAEHAALYFYCGNKDDNNPFHMGLYRLRYTDCRKREDEAQVYASKTLFDLEYSILDYNREELQEFSTEFNAEVTRILEG